MEYRYRDFDLLVDRSADGYEVRVVDSPAGNTTAIAFELPFDEVLLENYLLKLGHHRSSPRRGLDTTEADTARELGGALFDSLVRGTVRDQFMASLHATDSAGEGLRVRLRLTDVPELADLPWEFLYLRDQDRFLSQTVWTPVVRYLNLPQPTRPLVVTGPLGVLVMVSSPSDHPPLDVDKEWGNVRAALSGPSASGHVSVERIDPTLTALHKKLNSGTWHLLHFIGHGRFDHASGDGVLVLETDDGRGHDVRSADLGAILRNHRTMRLVVLNACEGARGGLTDPFAGSAQSLVRQGLPAVVAMQFEISDEAAVTFATGFYEQVAAGAPLEAAVANGRLAVFAEGNSTEWGTPVLHMRADDGHIFDLEQPRPDVEHRAPPAGDPRTPQLDDRTPSPPAGDPRTPQVDDPTPDHPSDDEQLRPPRDQPLDADHTRPPDDRPTPLLDRLRDTIRAHPLVAVGVALAVVAVLVAVVVGGGDGDDGGGLERVVALATVDVPAVEPFTDTGIDVLAGDTISVEVTGELFDDVNNNPDRSFGPDGVPDTANEHPGDPYRDLGFNHAALVAEVGDFQTVEVGSGLDFVAQESGPLVLAINDALFDDNDGGYVADIAVLRRNARE